MRALVLLGLLAASCATAPVEPAPFPESWFGTWAGDVTMTGPGGPMMEFQMELTVGPREEEGQYEWTIVYEGDQGRSERPYTLLVRDAAEGHYAIDEHNGIVLEARLLGDRLTTWFAVNGSQLVLHETLVDGGGDDEHLLFELISAPTDATRTGTDQFEVDSWLPTSSQRAVLRRR